MRLSPRHPWILLLSAGLAFSVWYGTVVERRERIAEKLVEASLTLVNVPSDLVITSDVPRSLSLRVRGALSRLTSLDPSQTGVVVDLRGAAEGTHEFSVGPDDVVVPSGIDVVAVSPSQVPLTLEKVMQRRIPIEPKTSGVPAPGQRVVGVSVDPTVALVSGPRSSIESLHVVTTDPVNIDGATGRMVATSPVRSPFPLVRVLQPLTASVAVDIEPVEPTPAPGKGGSKS